MLEICEAGTAAKHSQETTAKNGKEGRIRYFVLFKKSTLCFDSPSKYEN
jgi:hypothetical protein